MKKKVFAALFILWFIKSAALFIGFDRMPLLPNNDEMVVNECALSLSRHEGFRAASIPGPLKLDVYFGHYMPLFIFEQALLFKLFGLSVFTLRIPAIIFTILYSALFFLLLMRLLQLGVIDRFALSFSAFLFLIDPTSFVWARQGRADSLALCFALTAFLFVLNDKPQRIVRGLLGSLAIGLALSTHLTVLPIAIFYWVFVLSQAKSRFFLKALLFVSVSISVVLATWIIANGKHSVNAYHQLAAIIGHLKGQAGENLLGFKYFNDLLVGHKFGYFFTNGGLLVFLELASFSVIFLRFWLVKKVKDFNNILWRNALYYSVFFALLAIFMVAVIFSDSRTHRIIPLGPFALMALSIGLSHFSLRNRRLKLAAIISLAIFSVASLSAFYIYFSKLAREWDLRSPYRYQSLIQEIPEHKKILSTHLLWFGLSKADRDANFVIPDLPGETLSSYIEEPSRVKPYDVIILTDLDGVLDKPEIFGGNFRIYAVKDLFSKYTIWER